MTKPQKQTQSKFDTRIQNETKRQDDENDFDKSGCSDTSFAGPRLGDDRPAPPTASPLPPPSPAAPCPSLPPTTPPAPSHNCPTTYDSPSQHTWPPPPSPSHRSSPPNTPAQTSNPTTHFSDTQLNSGGLTKHDSLNTNLTSFKPHKRKRHPDSGWITSQTTSHQNSNNLKEWPQEPSRSGKEAAPKKEIIPQPPPPPPPPPPPTTTRFKKWQKNPSTSGKEVEREKEIVPGPPPPPPPPPHRPKKWQQRPFRSDGDEGQQTVIVQCPPPSSTHPARLKKKHREPAGFEQASVSGKEVKTERTKEKITHSPSPVQERSPTSGDKGNSGKEYHSTEKERHQTPPPPDLRTSGKRRLSGVARLLGLPGTSSTCQSPDVGSPHSPSYHKPPASPRQARRPANTSPSSGSTGESYPGTSTSQSQSSPDLTVPLSQPATDTRDSTTSATDSESNQHQGQQPRVPVALRRLLPFNMPGSKEGDQQQRRRRE